MAAGPQSWKSIPLLPSSNHGLALSFFHGPYSVVRSRELASPDSPRTEYSIRARDTRRQQVVSSLLSPSNTIPSRVLQTPSPAPHRHATPTPIAHPHPSCLASPSARPRPSHRLAPPTTAKSPLGPVAGAGVVAALYGARSLETPRRQPADFTRPSNPISACRSLSSALAVPSRALVLLKPVYVRL
jgi:hypothetical protein